MGRPCRCGCGSENCDCNPALLLEWAGDRDFTDDRDIRNYPLFRSRMLSRQRSQTSLFWRIRYNPDQEFLEWLTENRIVIDGSFFNATHFVEYFPFSNASAVLSGPIRDGILYGLDVVQVGDFEEQSSNSDPTVWPGKPSNPLTDAADAAFVGKANLSYYNTNGSEFPVNWTLEDFPDNPVDIPWSLELGCARCMALDSISWPERINWHYDPEVRFNPLSPGGLGNLAVDPDASTLVGTTVPSACEPITYDDLQSVYWPGDESEPHHEPVCLPDCIVWISCVYDPAPDLEWIGGGGRSVPGKSFGSDGPTHPAYALANSNVPTLLHLGWGGKLGLNDVVRAGRGDSAAIANVPCIWLVPPVGGDSHEILTYLYGFTTSDIDWLTEWLSLGNKTLLIDTPNKITASVDTGFPGSKVANANAFLSAVGSGMAFYEIEELTGTPSSQMQSATCRSTESHALALEPETLFSTTLDTSDLPLGGGTLLERNVLGMSGGTALFELDCVVRRNGSDVSETHPCIAIEEKGNNRIISGSILTGNTTAVADAAEWSRTGLHRVPGIGNLIGRIMASL